jgi:lipopolysaccharide export system protein LptC
VRLLKFGLPALAVLSVAGFFVVMAINRGGDGLPALTLSGINLHTREITMDKPHISGFDGTKQSYEVNAAKAVQALGNPKVVNLETIDANFAVADDVRARVVAKAGVYDADTQKLKLDGGIEITTTNGYTGRLDHADVEIEKGTVFSDTGVDLAGKEGRITADGIEVLDHGKHIVFRGNVKVHFTPPEDEARQPPTRMWPTRRPPRRRR